MTNRQIAGIFGLLFFSAEVLNFPLCFLFDQMKWYSKTMSECANAWNEERSVPECVRNELKSFFNKLYTNPETPMFDIRKTEEYEPDLTLVVDACETGWGCVSTSGTETKFYGAPWSEDDHQKYFLFSSVVSEPLGAWRAIQRNVSINHKKVVVYTDHQPQVWAMQRGVAHANSYNELQVKLKQHFHDTVFEFRFIRGVDNNIADALSRFGSEICG